jgi:hypothetical protein
MPYNTELEVRIDQTTVAWGKLLGKRKMFSGLAYFIAGNMCFAIRDDELLLRLDDKQADELLKSPGVHIAVMGKRQMKNWLQAGGPAIAGPAQLLALLTIGRDYALSLPPKE